MMRGRALRYVGWQIVDRAGYRFLACLIISLAIMTPIHFGVRNDPPGPEAARMLLGQLHQQFAYIFVLLFANGIVSEDRTKGYFRFYFAKPVSPLWFYGQQAVLALLFLIAASAAFVVLFSLLIVPVWSFAVLQRTLALWLLFGMLIAMFSTLSKLDWLWAVVALFAGAVARGQFPADKSNLGKVLHAIMPPNQLLSLDATLGTRQWLWLAGWAIGLFVLMLVLLARRPLAED